MFEQTLNASSSGFFQISPTIDNAKHVFVFLQRIKDNDQDANPYEYDTFNINASRNNASFFWTCRLEYDNGEFYPEVDNDTESKLRIFSDLMSYTMRKNDYNSGAQLNLSNFNSLYGVIYFGLTCQTEKVTKDPKKLIFRYKLNAQTREDSPYTVNAVVLDNKVLIVN